MKRRIIAVLAIAGLLVCMSGCKKEEDRYCNTPISNDEIIRVGIDTSMQGKALYDDFYDCINGQYTNVELMQMSPEEQIEKYLDGTIDVALNIPLDQKKYVAKSSEGLFLNSDENVGLRFNPEADCFADIKDMKSFYQGLTIVFDRVYEQEKVEGLSQSPIETEFIQEHDYDVNRTGVLNVDDAMDILGQSGLTFMTEGDGTYNTSNDMLVPLEVLEGDREAMALAEAVLSDLDVIGITIEIHPLPLDEYMQSLNDKTYHLIIETSDENDESNGFIPLWEKRNIILKKSNIDIADTLDDGNNIVDEINGWKKDKR